MYCFHDQLELYRGYQYSRCANRCIKIEKAIYAHVSIAVEPCVCNGQYHENRNEINAAIGGTAPKINGEMR